MAVTRSQIEATIASLTDNLAQDVEWFGADSNEAAGKRRLLERAEANLRALEKGVRPAIS